MAWAALPALIVTIPRSRSALGIVAIAYVAPRGLKEPVRWRLSALRNARAPMRSPSERLDRSGVRWM